MNASPVEAVTAEGIRLRDGTLVELDIIVFATGFGSVTEGGGYGADAYCGHVRMARQFRSIGRIGRARRWGLRWRIFLNMFFLYGLQAPTAFKNVPNCVHLRG